jgi:hypothetical protein
MRLGTPGFVGRDHGVEGDDLLPYAGGESDFLRLCTLEEPVVEGPDYGIMSGGRESDHVAPASLLVGRLLAAMQAAR